MKTKKQILENLIDALDEAKPILLDVKTETNSKAAFQNVLKPLQNRPTQK